MTTQIFRVLVRGQFDRLSERTRAFLIANAADHEPVSARFDVEPNFTYPPALDSFGIRLEVRVESDDADEARLEAERRGFDEASNFLRVLGITHKRLRAIPIEMNAPER